MRPPPPSGNPEARGAQPALCGPGRPGERDTHGSKSQRGPGRLQGSPQQALPSGPLAPCQVSDRPWVLRARVRGRPELSHRCTPSHRPSPGRTAGTRLLLFIRQKHRTKRTAKGVNSRSGRRERVTSEGERLPGPAQRPLSQQEPGHPAPPDDTPLSVSDVLMKM